MNRPARRCLRAGARPAPTLLPSYETLLRDERLQFRLESTKCCGRADHLCERLVYMVLNDIRKVRVHGRDRAWQGILQDWRQFGEERLLRLHIRIVVDTL